MKRKISRLKIVAWTIIGLWLTRSIIFRIVNIDFTTMEIARNFRIVWIVLIPLAIGLLIFESWKENTSLTKKVFELSSGLLLSVGLIVVLNFFSSFCEWQFKYVLYTHKSRNMKIQKRFLDCGATTSGEPYDCVITKPIGNYLLKYESVELNKLDTTEWK